MSSIPALEIGAHFEPRGTLYPHRRKHLLYLYSAEGSSGSLHNTIIRVSGVSNVWTTSKKSCRPLHRCCCIFETITPSPKYRTMQWHLEKAKVSPESSLGESKLYVRVPPTVSTCRESAKPGVEIVRGRRTNRL